MSENPAERSVPTWDTADRMRKALREAGLGVQEMADYLGVARTTLSNWINGRIEPSTQTLRLWALRTGVPFAWLSDSAGSPKVMVRMGSRSGRSLRSISVPGRVGAFAHAAPGRCGAA